MMMIKKVNRENMGEIYPSPIATYVCKIWYHCNIRVKYLPSSDDVVFKTT